MLRLKTDSPKQPITQINRPRLGNLPQVGNQCCIA